MLRRTVLLFVFTLIVQNSNKKKGQVFGNLISHSFTMKLLENFKQKYVDVGDLNLRWDLIKMKIRGFTVKYSKNKSGERKSTETILQYRINNLFKSAKAELNNKHIICEIQSKRLRLKKIMQYKTKGAIIRSKVMWYEDGERNTCYFYNLEKRNYE